ncbi:MAG TPA: lipopolysaccharide assembly protein LapB [Gammaproteobacteria bacterium]|nr:lipopolysaccharide assembly protein LapB [Gammaproteobacteria bacterium]HEV2613693.1 lipopolysaccharide assembly protein LapB [Gammaproteobacteria bacterium]
MFLMLVIALAVVVGCYVGQKYLGDTTSSQKPLSRDYFVGLNYLLNEEQDKAVDVFTRLIHVDSETVETHLALGSLFRRRGEIGRAIKIHQNLIARPQLSKDQRITALVALGKDYLHAGLVDRAEKLFLEISAFGNQPAISLKYLLEIYQQQKNWPEAIKVATQLKSMLPDNMDIQIAHYHCELAQVYIQKKEFDLAIQELKKALKQDLNSVRANLLWAKVELDAERYKAAIDIYEQILDQDKAFFAEALPALIEAHQKLDRETELVDFLNNRLANIVSITVILFLTDYKRKADGDEKAIEFLIQQLQGHPSLKGLQYLVAYHLESTQEKDWLIIKELIQHLLKHQPNYRCSQCGFKSNLLLWLCPGCKSWSCIKPVLN